MYVHIQEEENKQRQTLYNQQVVVSIDIKWKEKIRNSQHTVPVGTVPVITVEPARYPTWSKL